MSDEDLPVAVRESTMQIGAMTVRVYHLDDGRRVIHHDDALAAMTAMGLVELELSETQGEA